MPETQEERTLFTFRFQEGQPVPRVELVSTQFDDEGGFGGRIVMCDPNWTFETNNYFLVEYVNDFADKLQMLIDGHRAHASLLSSNENLCMSFYSTASRDVCFDIKCIDDRRETFIFRAGGYTFPVSELYQVIRSLSAFLLGLHPTDV